MVISKRWFLPLALSIALFGGVAVLVKAAPHPKPKPQYAEWRRARSMPVPARESGAAVIRSKLYLFGGFSTYDVKATDAVQVFDPATGTWSRLHPMPRPVTHINPALDGDTVWFAGGFMGNNPGPAVTDVWKYVISADRWLPGPPLPRPNASGALVRVGRRLHYFGGYMADRMTNPPDHWVMDLDSATGWRPAAPFPQSRGHFPGVEVGGQIFALGGAFHHDPTPRDVALVHRYDPATDHWTQLTPAPTPRSHAEPGTVHDEDRVVLVGGRDNHRGRVRQHEVLSSIVTYDPATDVWMNLGTLPNDLGGPAAGLFGDTLVVAGGGLGDDMRPVADTWELPFRDAWRQLPPLPVPLGDVAAGVIGRYLYVIGGGNAGTLRYDLSAAEWLPADALSQRPFAGHHQAAEAWDGKLYVFGGFQAEGRTQIYDPVRDIWKVGADVPFRAASSVSAVIGGRIYVAAGLAGRSPTGQAAVYDPATDRWSSIESMPHPRHHAAAATDGRRLFVFGGREGGAGVSDGVAEVQIYDPATNRWSSSNDPSAGMAPLPFGRGGTGKAVFLGGRFYVLGGETRSDAGATPAKVYARVDIYDPQRNRWVSGQPMPVPRQGAFPVAAFGRILVAGGNDRADWGPSTAFDYYTPPASAAPAAMAASGPAARTP